MSQALVIVNHTYFVGEAAGHIFPVNYVEENNREGFLCVGLLLI